MLYKRLKINFLTSSSEDEDEEIIEESGDRLPKKPRYEEEEILEESEEKKLIDKENFSDTQSESESESESECESENKEESSEEEKKRESEGLDYYRKLIKKNLEENIINGYKEEEINIKKWEKLVIREGIEKTFKDFNELINEILLVREYEEKEEIEEIELNNEINKEEKERLKNKLKQLREEQEKTKINIKDIIDNNLNRDTQKKLLNLYDILQTLEENSLEYITLSIKIKDIIKNSNSTNNDISLKEDQLIQIIGNQRSLKDRILLSNIDDKKKAVIFEKYLQLQKMPEDTTTAASIHEWIEEVLKTPFEEISGNNPLMNGNKGESLIKLKKAFKENLSEMDEVLEPLLTIFNNKMNKKDTSNLVIGLLGSPGTGKTCVGQVLADVWGLPFHQISLGGIVDSSILDGQHSGWVGSTPGRFVKALQEMGVKDGVIFLDEIDKLGTTANGLQVQYSLLHSTDPIQNKEFHDHYLGSKLPIDLSKCLIICALNSTNGLDPALLSRMQIIEVPDYNKTKKINILLKHLLPFACKNAGVDINNIILSKETANYLVQKVENNIGKEGGVRGLKNIIQILINKISLLLSTNKEQQNELKLTFKIENIKTPLEITEEIIDNLYKTNNYENISWRKMYM